MTSVAAGASAAAMHGNILILPLSLCLLFGISAQLSINLLHRYNDERYHFGDNEDDGINLGSIPFSTKSVFREAMIGSSMVTAMIGLTLIAMAGPDMILFGVLLVGLALLLNLGRHPLGRTPWGVGLSSLAFGPVGTTAVCLMQSSRESVNDFNWYDLGPALYIGFAVGFLVANWMIVHNYAHIDTDRIHHKETLPVKIGRGGSRIMIMVNACCCAAIVFALAIREYQEYWIQLTAVPVVVIPLYAILINKIRKATPADFPRLLTLAGIIMMLVPIGLLIVFCLTGIPVDTHLRIINS